ncbi:MAG: hypothetical protein EP343_10110 [Deltaproteobacteria bacterium]|nr:MAG: hypothetical protein EP343_10110 [Deltaproteobacteria bacterium]
MRVSCSLGVKRLSFLAVVLAMVMATTSPVGAKSVQWASNSDWSQGNPTNVTWTKTPNQLEIVFNPNSVVETPFIYIPSSSLNTITKMDTRNGQILWTFNLAPLGKGSSPSRTTVDADGNVWVGLRNGSYVVAISAEGKYLAAVNVGSGPRAVTIDKQGNIWAGGYNAQSIVKISRQTFKPILTVRNSGICTYGATTDASGNIWTLNRCKGTVTKITSSGQIVKTVSTPGCYGIMADRIGYVWVASWERAQVFRINASSYAVQTYNLGAKGRGVAIDSQNRAWVACSHATNNQETRHVARVDPSNGQVSIFRNVGPHTIGVAIDSKGFVWANSYREGLAYKLRVSDGTKVAAYPICDTTGTRPCANSGCTRCSSPAQSGPYTYSDMTGFSIQTKPANGTWTISYNAKCKAKFNQISWTGSTPSGTTVKVRARSASTASGLASASWGSYISSGQSPGVSPNAWIQIEFRMETNDARYTPVVKNAQLSFDHYTEVCDGIDNDCDGSVDENWSDLGQACDVGVGACNRKGKRVCNSQQNGTVCSAQPGQPTNEICDGIDNDCDGQVDETFTDLGQSCDVGLGVCKRTGQRVCDPSRTKTTCSATPGQPQIELCDGLDNNCDGSVDEKWPNKGTSCVVGVGSCQNQGTWICMNDKSGVACSVPPKAPQPEICDGKDNDCNGVVDDGLIRACQTKCGNGTERCVAGNWAACSARTPTTETCNDQDDDCNGQVDDNLSRVCSTACGKGKESCVRGKWVFCDAQKPEAETCDGKDNDCNGQIDDGLQPRRCLGDCGEGTATCKGGKWGGCSGPSPEPELCDGKDNDCNGSIDDNLTKKCRTACGEGRQVCQSGSWSLCNAPQPGKEICDSKDNDCDGRIDNGADALCPSGMLCESGRCQNRCRSGECPGGQRCISGICVSDKDPCENVKCPTDQRCVSGKCIDACYLVSCPDKQVCEKGKCVEDNCYRKGCPNGQRCVEGVCESDPCDKVKCKTNEFCRDGKCVSTCAKVKCKTNEECVDGSCKAKPTDPCDNVRCGPTERCVSGKCEADPCDGVTCPKGRTCRNGQCRHDPCFNIFCPEGQVCVENQCVGDPKNPPTEGPTNGEGNTNAGEGVTSAENPTSTNDGGPNNQTDDPNSGTGDGPSGLADKSGGNPTGLPDDGSTRYQPGNCGCQQQGGSGPFLLWLALFGLLFYFRRFSFKRLK